MNQRIKALIPGLMSMIVVACGSSPQVTSAEPSIPVVTQSQPTAGEFSFEFSNMQCDPDEDPPRPGSAYVTITKMDPKFGRVEWKKIQQEGDRLGWTERGDTVTSVHRVVTAGGKAVLVDFNSGARLRRVVAGKIVVYQSRHCPFMERAMVKCPGPRIENSSYKVDEAVYTTASNTILTYSKPAGVGPRKDTLCPLHGGKDGPPPWTPEEIKKALGEEAERILGQAEGGWNSRNPKVRLRSRDLYRQLLKEYPTERVVIQYRDRIKERAAVEIEE